MFTNNTITKHTQPTPTHATRSLHTSTHYITYLHTQTNKLIMTLWFSPHLKTSHKKNNQNKNQFSPFNTPQHWYTHPQAHTTISTNTSSQYQNAKRRDNKSTDLEADFGPHWPLPQATNTPQHSTRNHITPSTHTHHHLPKFFQISLIIMTQPISPMMMMMINSFIRCHYHTHPSLLTIKSTRTIYSICRLLSFVPILLFLDCLVTCGNGQQWKAKWRDGDKDGTTKYWVNIW